MAGHPAVTGAELELLQTAELQAETNLPGAIATLRTGLAPNSSAALDFAFGRMQIRAGHTGPGTKSLQRAGEKAPKYRAVWRTLGLVQSNHGQYSSALDAFARMLALDPNDADALALSGAAHALAGAHPSAQRAYREALRFSTPGPESQAIRMDLVRSLFATQDYSVARLELEQVHSDNGNDPELRLLEAQLSLAAGETSRAEACLSGLVSNSTDLEDWPETCFTLAWTHLKAKQPERAAQWMQRAAEGGLPAAQSEFGKMLLDGRGVTSNAQVGAKWMAQAADSGLPSAMSNLALLHMRGQGVKKDVTRASELYAKAAKAGEPEACLRLGMLYSTGTGVRANPILAEFWFECGAAAGSEECAQQLALFESGGLTAPTAR